MLPPPLQLKPPYKDTALRLLFAVHVPDRGFLRSDRRSHRRKVFTFRPLKQQRWPGQGSVFLLTFCQDGNQQEQLQVEEEPQLAQKQ